MRKLMILAAIVAICASPLKAQAEVLPSATPGVALAPFASFLILGFGIAYLDATQSGPTDGPFYAFFPVVEQTYPDSGHHNGH